MFERRKAVGPIGAVGPKRCCCLPLSLVSLFLLSDTSQWGTPGFDKSCPPLWADAHLDARKGGGIATKGGVSETKGGVLETKGRVPETKGRVLERKGGVLKTKGCTAPQGKAVRAGMFARECERNSSGLVMTYSCNPHGESRLQLAAMPMDNPHCSLAAIPMDSPCCS